MIIDKLQEKKDFTTSETAIADYLLSMTSSSFDLSTKELADATYTSKATVTRFCQRLGCSSYRQFQKTLNKELEQLQRIHTRISEEPVEAGMHYSDVMNILPELYEQSISDVKTHLNSATIYKAVEHIRQAKKIDIYGSGVTESIANLCAFKFSTLGLECSTQSGLNEHYILADRAPQDKVIIIFSLTGGNPNMIHIAKWLKKRGYYIIGIGGDKSDGLKSLCSEYISLPMRQRIIGVEIVYAFNLVNYVVDVLFMSLLIKDYSHHREVATRLLLEDLET